MKLYRLIYNGHEAWYYNKTKLFQAKMNNGEPTLRTQLRLIWFITKQIITRKVYLPNNFHDVMVITMPADGYFPERLEDG